MTIELGNNITDKSLKVSQAEEKGNISTPLNEGIDTKLLNQDLHFDDIEELGEASQKDVSTLKKSKRQNIRKSAKKFKKIEDPNKDIN